MSKTSPQDEISEDLEEWLEPESPSEDQPAIPIIESCNEAISSPLADIQSLLMTRPPNSTMAIVEYGEADAPYASTVVSSRDNDDDTIAGMTVSLQLFVE